jgi:hypothetical protein
MGCGSSKLRDTATELEDEVEKARLAIEVRKIQGKIRLSRHACLTKNWSWSDPMSTECTCQGRAMHTSTCITCKHSRQWAGTNDMLASI